jgi:acyl-CoA reductase-like NAD-dependent aldehyde dehydrogenase
MTGTLAANSDFIACCRIEVVYQPLGVVVGIAPWNFPAVVGLLKWATPVIGGNTAVIKVFI